MVLLHSFAFHWSVNKTAHVHSTFGTFVYYCWHQRFTCHWSFILGTRWNGGGYPSDMRVGTPSGGKPADNRASHLFSYQAYLVKKNNKFLQYIIFWVYPVGLKPQWIFLTFSVIGRRMRWKYIDKILGKYF